ncbi:MAG: hypothetical protein GY928_36910 [Colwellia sp.]|nr:hypothetical protein [Colwellia sp.]
MPQKTHHISLLNYIIYRNKRFYFWNKSSQRFEKYQKILVHPYFRITQLCWWDKINFSHVCYDNWQLVSFDMSIYDQSKTVFQEIWKLFVAKMKNEMKLNSRWMKYLVKKYLGQSNAEMVTNQDWESYYLNNEWQPIQCKPFWWKTNQEIGSIITDKLLHPVEWKVYQYILAQKICTKVEYDSKGAITKVTPVSDDTVDPLWQQKFADHPQQYDFSAPGRVKYFCGDAHYCHPVIGNRNKYRNPDVLRKYKHMLIPKGRNSDGWGSVLAHIDEKSQDFPKLLQKIKEFVGLRLKAIELDHKTANQMQLNGYKEKKGEIHNHFDSFNHYNEVVLNKVVNDSGLHTQMKSFTKIIINQTMFHPLREGMWLKLTKWIRTWFQHCKLRWMNCPSVAGSITAIYRQVNTKEAIFYPFPRIVNPNPRPTAQSQVVYQQYIKKITKPN